MATISEMTSALASHLATTTEWDERAERLVRESARAMLSTGMERSATARELVSLGVYRPYARRIVSDIARQLGLPPGPGLLARICARLAQSRGGVSLQATARNHRSTILTLIATVVLMGVAWAVHRYAFYRMTPEERAFLDNVQAQYAATNDRDGLVDTPWLIEASEKNYVTAARFLLAHGANVIAATPSGQTPLHVCGDAAMCRLLLKNGADVRRCDKDGQTPLHAAVQRIPIRKTTPPEKIVRLLLRHGAQVNAPDNSGQTPLDQSIGIDMAVFLMRHGGRAGAAQAARLVAEVAGQDHYRDVLASLLNVGAGANAEASRSFPSFRAYPLQRAVLGNAAKNIALLLEHGADPTVTFPPDTWAGDSFDVFASQREAESEARVRNEFPHLRFPDASRQELMKKHDLIPIGGMTPLQAAERIGAEAAAAALRKHLRGE